MRIIIFSLLINAVMLLLDCLLLLLYLYIHYLSVRFFSLLKHYFDLSITDTALNVSRSLSLYCFTISVSHGVENYFPGLFGMGMLFSFEV